MADDTRYAYAVARVRGLETRLLDRQWIERLLSEDAAGALRVLGDSPYQDAVSDVERPEDVEAGLVKALAETLTVVSALCPEPELIELFRLRWDFRNMKSLVKASVLNVGLEGDGEGPAADVGLTDGIGTVELDTLAAAVRDGDYVSLPAVLSEAAKEAVESFRDTGELAAIDRALDRALWSHQLAVAGEKSNDFLGGYFRTEIDLLNIKAFIRAKEAGLDSTELRKRLIPGGRLDAGLFESHLGEPSDAFARAMEYGRYGALAPVFRDWSRERAFALELACDDVLLAEVERAKTIAYGIEPLVAYVLVRQIEMKLVRAAVAAKLDGVSREAIEERLRSVHV